MSTTFAPCVKCTTFTPCVEGTTFAPCVKCTTFTPCVEGTTLDPCVEGITLALCWRYYPRSMCWVYYARSMCWGYYLRPMCWGYYHHSMSWGYYPRSMCQGYYPRSMCQGYYPHIQHHHWLSLQPLSSCGIKYIVDDCYLSPWVVVMYTVTFVGGTRLCPSPASRSRGTFFHMFVEGEKEGWGWWRIQTYSNRNWNLHFCLWSSI